MATMDKPTFQNIALHGKAIRGVFRMDKEQLGWKGNDGKSTVQHAAADLASAEWLPACGKSKGLLKLKLKNSDVVRFGGFEHSDLQTIKAHLHAHFNVQLAEVPVSTAGWSWGDFRLTSSNSARLMQGEKVCLDIDYPDLNQVQAVGKHELDLELLEETSVHPEDEVVYSARFFIPAGTSGDGVGTTAESLRDELLRLANLTSTGESLAVIRDVSMIVPRGKHDLEFFPEAIKVRGKTQTYTVKYNSITRLFLLEMPNNRQKMVVIGLKKPLQQASKSYVFVGMMFENSVKVNTVDSVPKEAWQAASNLKTSRDKVVSAEGLMPAVDLTLYLMKEISDTKVIAPTSKLQLPEGKNCVACSLGADNGHLFFFEKQMLWVHKPITWILYQNVSGVELKLSPMRKSTFDMLVTHSGQVSEFKQIERTNFQVILDFMEENQYLAGKIVNKDSATRNIQTVAERRAERAVASDRSLPVAGKAAAPPMADDTYDEEADEDFDDEADDSEADEGDDDDDDDEPLAAPRQKRLRSSR